MSLINSDQLNIIFLIVSIIVAYIVPIELVLISYAFLGPAHYLTQISWMHDRQYFVQSNNLLWIFLGLGLLYTLFFYMAFDSPVIYMYLLLISVAVSISVIYAAHAKSRFIVFMIALVGMGVAVEVAPKIAIGIAILLPTFIHIYVFTFLFMLFGSIKNNSKWGYLSCALMLAIIPLLIVVEPKAVIFFPEMTEGNIGFFSGTADLLAVLFSFGGAVDGVSMLALLSFAYTYHYLNWFGKVNVIRWNQISKQRLAVIVALYILSVSFYLYDYTTGLMILLFLSILHVLLELPLNLITMQNIIKKIISQRNGGKKEQA